MTALGDLLGRLDPDPLRRGKQFERICQWFLTHNPVHTAMLRPDRVWLWDEWPGRWGADAGIDLVAEDHDGHLWAIQAKAYDKTTSITKRDVNTFLSESARAEFSFRLLIATTDEMGHRAKSTIEGQEKRASVLLRADLEAFEVDWPASPDDLRSRQPPPKEPLPYQCEAIEEVVEGFDSTDRGQLIMACGTGKTLTALFIKEKLAAERTLVLLPSLSLLAQTLREWTANKKAGFDPLPVCSDDTVVEPDAAVANTSELGFPVTTDAEEIATFLRRSGPRVVFATYQSSPEIARAFGLGDVPAFDLVVADEAHRCAGRVSSAFGTILDSGAIGARRRLFMTATPRYFTGRVMREAKEADFEVASMDDEAVFGPVFHRLGFAEAIKRDLLTDYQVVVIGVDDAIYREWAERGRFVTTDGTEVTDARTLAGQIGLAKAMRRYDLHRTISFHSRVKRAQEFARSLPDVIAWMPAEQRPTGQMWFDYASGEMSARQRQLRLHHLGTIDRGERGLLANARCLAEGVDVPTLDGVAFIDPRRSEVDIVQAVGRAIRRAQNKKVGTIVIPVFIDTDEDPAIALDDSAFKPVWDVIKALRSHDDKLGEQLDELRRQLGQRGRRPRLPGKVHLDLPARVGSDFARAFDVRLVEQTTASWEFWFGLLEQFVERNGDARVASSYTVDGYQLGMWVATQRYMHAKGTLDADRQHRLQDVTGWTWDPLADAWAESLAAARAFAEREGHARIPRGHVENGINIGHWVAIQRRDRDKLSPERRTQLEAIPGWTWDPFTDAWNQNYAALTTFVDREGHARVPGSHVEKGVRLGKWVTVQRGNKDQLSEERRARLESLPGWGWDARADSWAQKLAALRNFVDREGHARIPQGHSENDIKLGSWVLEQRMNQDKMSKERRAQLEALPGWSWNPHTGAWNETYAVLKEFADREGHARVPKEYVENGVKLGSWVGEQRMNQDKLSKERRTRLESLPGWSWDAVADAFAENLAALHAFVAREGHARVPVDHIENGLKLGQWARIRRRNRDKLSPQARAQLEAIPGWGWDRHADTAWAEKYAALKSFVEREGHARVPDRHMENGVKLGSWVREQRSNKDKLTRQRRERLEALPGWTWEPSAYAWAEKYAALKSFVEREGHTRVPQSHVEKGVRLGSWVAVQRGKKGTLSAGRRAQLEALPGWSWNPYADSWAKNLAALDNFVEREGHARVPCSCIENGIRLGAWIYRTPDMGRGWWAVPSR